MIILSVTDIRKEGSPHMIKLEGVGHDDNRPSTAEAPSIGKIHPFSKIAVSLEPVM